MISCGSECERALAGCAIVLVEFYEEEEKKRKHILKYRLRTLTDIRVVFPETFSWLKAQRLAQFTNKNHVFVHVGGRDTQEMILRALAVCGWLGRKKKKRITLKLRRHYWVHFTTAD